MGNTNSFVDSNNLQPKPSTSSKSLSSSNQSCLYVSWKRYYF